MAATDNVAAVMDSVTGKVHAIIVDAPEPHSFWTTAFQTQAGNPLMTMDVPILTYNTTSAAALPAILNTLFNAAKATLKL